MELVFSSLIKVFLDKGILFFLLFFVAFVLFSWLTRDKFERIFLSRVTILSFRLVIEILCFVGISFSALLLNYNVENVINGETSLWIDFAFYLYFLIFIFSTFYGSNFKNITSHSIFGSKPFNIGIVVLLIFLSWTIYQHFINILLASFNGILEEDLVTTRQVAEVLLTKEQTIEIYISLFLFLGFFYILIKGMGQLLVSLHLQDINFLNVHRAQLVTVGLKNGKVVKDVYMRHNHAGKYIHLLNKETAYTQVLVVNKDEIEYFLLRDSKFDSTDSPNISIVSEDNR